MDKYKMNGTKQSFIIVSCSISSFIIFFCRLFVEISYRKASYEIITVLIAIFIGIIIARFTYKSFYKFLYKCLYRRV